MKPSTSDDESTWEPLNAKSTSEIAKPTWSYDPHNFELVPEWQPAVGDRVRVVEFVNPLVETMKRLSSNIITDQRAAA